MKFAATLVYEPEPGHLTTVYGRILEGKDCTLTIGDLTDTIPQAEEFLSKLLGGRVAISFTTSVDSPDLAEQIRQDLLAANRLV